MTLLFTVQFEPLYSAIEAQPSLPVNVLCVTVPPSTLSTSIGVPLPVNVLFVTTGPPIGAPETGCT